MSLPKRHLHSSGMTDFDYLVAVLVLILGLLPAVAGCGIKAPPVTPGEPPPVVTNLVHTLKNGTLTLAWDLAGDSPTVRQYTLYQSKEAVTDEPCEGCPLVFKRGVTIAAGSQRNGTHALKLEKGFRYGFKVTASTENGREGPATRTVIIVYK